MTRIEPQLWVDRASQAVDFYVEASGATVVHRVGEGDDIVAQLSIGEAAFWVASAGPDIGRFGPLAIGGVTGRTLLVAEDPEAVADRAVRAGAAEKSPVGEEHGWRLGRIVDLLATSGRSASPSSLGRRIRHSLADFRHAA